MYIRLKQNLPPQNPIKPGEEPRPPFDREALLPVLPGVIFDVMGPLEEGAPWYFNYFIPGTQPDSYQFPSEEAATEALDAIMLGLANPDDPDYKVIDLRDLQS